MALIRRHPLGGKVLQLRNQLPLLVEEFLGLIAAHPGFEQFEVGWVGSYVRNRDLVRPPEALQVVPVDLPWGRPALGAAQNDRGPARPLEHIAFWRCRMDRDSKNVLTFSIGSYR
jgi:hypothetical protein